MIKFTVGALCEESAILVPLASSTRKHYYYYYSSIVGYQLIWNYLRWRSGVRYATQVRNQMKVSSEVSSKVLVYLKNKLSYAKV